MRLISSLFVLIFTFFSVFQSAFAKSYDDIHIAVAGDMSGKDAHAGESLINGVKLYINSINEKGGINGRNIVLDIFDDQNNKNVAKEKALEIVEQNKAIAVIGHHYSSCSISAGEVYRGNGIPAITPFSTNVGVTKDNIWYFRNIFNDNLQGCFLANYVDKVFQTNSVCIIHEDLAYGLYLADVFEKKARELGIEIKYKFGFKVDDETQDNIFNNYIQELKSANFTGVIFLATHVSEGVKLVKLIKDAELQNPVVVPDAFASKSFNQGFSTYPEEKMNPGYYSNGLYVTSPLLFDSADEEAQRFKEIYQSEYKTEPDWRAVLAYEAAMIVVHALKNSGITGDANMLTEDRKKIRDFLAGMNNIKNSLKSVTGYNYFDKNGDSQKPISIGLYRNNNTISALHQLRAIGNIKEIFNLNTAIENKKILFIDDNYMYKTNVIYTGIKIIEITELDMQDLSCIIDFYLWFRYKGNLDIKNIEFLNVVEPVELSDPLEKIETNEYSYSLFQVKGKFKQDFLLSRPSFGQHVLGISFRNRDLSRNYLIYVADLIGMGMTEGKDPVKELKNTQVLAPIYNWKLDRIRSFQDNIQVNSLGNPKYVNLPEETVTYSRFNYGIIVKEDVISFIGIIPSEYRLYILLACFIGLIAILLINKKNLSNFYRQLVWLCGTILTCLFLLSGEGVCINSLVDKIDLKYLKILLTTFDVLWWVVPAFLIVFAVERFIWKPLEDRTNQVIPNLVRRIVGLLIFVLAFFGIVAFVLDQKLTGLLATSGVIAMVIGLALQMNLTHVFSGIALNMERPFRVGDWIQVGEYEGKVIDITWRATRIETIMENIVSIPNSMATESIIENFHFPTSTYWVGFTVHIAPNHEPEKVMEILEEAVNATEGKVDDPWVEYVGITEWSADYWVYMSAEDYETKWEMYGALWRNVYKYLKKAGISPVIQRYEVKMLSEKPMKKSK